jgi:hypothetical protein
MNNFRIRGRRKDHKRGGAYFGISMDDDLPVFGGGNLIHAPIWWNTTKEAMQAIIGRMQAKFPECEFNIEVLN